MMAAILNCCNLGFSHFAQKNFTHAFSLKLMMASILNSAIMDSSILHKKIFTCSFWLKLIHFHSTWWWQPSWILPSSIQQFCTKLWLQLIKSDSNSFILTELDDDSHLELAILDSAILVFPLKLTHTCQDWIPPFAQKKPSLIHSDSTWWWQPSWILPCRIQTLPSWIQTPSYLFSDLLKTTLTPPWLWLQTNSIWLKVTFIFT